VLAGLGLKAGERRIRRNYGTALAVSFDAISGHPAELWSIWPDGREMCAGVFSWFATKV
jgi:hypothetical protein